MKYKTLMYKFFQVCSGILFLIAVAHVLKGNTPNAILSVLIAMHTNMLSWNYEDYDKEE